jgi:hypothetical protein
VSQHLAEQRRASDDRQGSHSRCACQFMHPPRIQPASAV